MDSVGLGEGGIANRSNKANGLEANMRIDCIRFGLALGDDERPPKMARRIARNHFPTDAENSAPSAGWNEE